MGFNFYTLYWTEGKTKKDVTLYIDGDELGNLVLECINALKKGKPRCGISNDGCRWTVGEDYFMFTVLDKTHWVDEGESEEIHLFVTYKMIDKEVHKFTPGMTFPNDLTPLEKNKLQKKIIEGMWNLYNNQ